MEAEKLSTWIDGTIPEAKFPFLFEKFYETNVVMKGGMNRRLYETEGSAGARKYRFKKKFRKKVKKGVDNLKD